jgi:sporulation protein YlmC with PRC-barrel domain
MVRKKRKSFKQGSLIQNKSCSNMAKTEKSLTREALVSMQVIDSKGRLLGKVKDVAFVVGQSSISLAVENVNGETQSIPWRDIQAASDFILLKPPFQSTNLTESTKKEDLEGVFQEEQTKQTQQALPKKQSRERSWFHLGIGGKASEPKQLCPICNRPLKWIPQYQRWYCYNDKKYV